MKVPKKLLLSLFLLVAFLAVPLVIVYNLRFNQETRSQASQGDDVTDTQQLNNSTTAEKTKNAFYLGFSVEPVADKQIQEMARVVEGQQITIINAFVQWGNPYNSRLTPEFFQLYKRRGVTPMITWEPWNPSAGVEQKEYTLESITAGEHDEYIRESARAIARADMPVFIRFAHEMNSNWYPWSGITNTNSSDEYKAAWKYVVDIFKSESVTNVTWVWSPHASDVPADPLNAFEEYYPGDEYVDWIGLDGYNWGSTRPNEGWRSFDQIFSDAYQRATSLSTKPIMIAETGSTELGGQKDLWLKEAIETTLPQKFTRVRAVVFFNLKKETDWRVQSSPTALTQFIDSLDVVSPASSIRVENNKIVVPN
jgi:beta-mannanase